MGSIALDWLTRQLEMVHVPVVNAVFLGALSLLSGGWIFRSKHPSTDIPNSRTGAESVYQDDSIATRTLMVVEMNESGSHSREEATSPKAGKISFPSTVTTTTVSMPENAVKVPSRTQNSFGSERERRPRVIPEGDPRAKQSKALEKLDLLDKHRLAPGTSIEELRTGRWLIFVWAEWCPHSRNYYKVWQELISRYYDPAASPWHEGQEDDNKIPRLVSTTIKDNPELVASFKMEKLPTFILLDEGKARGRVIASPSIEQLHELLRSDWSTITPSGSGRALSGKTSEILVASMKLFDFLGQITYQTEEFLFHWIANHKPIVYIALVINMFLIYRLRKSPLIDYL